MSEADTRIRFAYDPDSAETRFMKRAVFGQWRTAIELFGVVVMLLFIYLVVRIAVREYSEFFAALHPAFVRIAPLVFWGGILLGITGAYLCGLLVTRLHETLVEVDRETILYKKGPIDVTLDEEGIHTKSPYSAEFVSWPSVNNIVSTPQGLGLRLDNTNFIPVLDQELPQGTDRNAVLSAIEKWRSA